MKTLFTYCDESGNTGNAIKDPAQPVLSYASIISEMDLDSQPLPEIAAVCKLTDLKYLHAKDIEDRHLASACKILLPLLNRLGVQFFYCPINKIDFAKVKLFDLFFDSGLNPRVTAIHYGRRAARLPLTVSFIQTVSNESAIEFWGHYLKGEFGKLRETIGEIFDGFCGYTEFDHRTRELIIDALAFYMDNPEKFHESLTTTRFGSPNLAGFSLLLQMIKEHYSEADYTIAEVKHDIMQQFSEEISELFAIQGQYIHDTSPMSMISDILTSGLMPPKVIFERGANSQGIQLVDFIAYIVQLKKKGKLPDGKEFNSFLGWVGNNGWNSGLSLPLLVQEVQGINNYLKALKLTPKQLAENKEFLDRMEAKRKGNARANK